MNVRQGRRATRVLLNRCSDPSAKRLAGQNPAAKTLKAPIPTVTGTLNELKLDGTFERDQLRLTATRPDGKEWGKFEGRLQGDAIAGTVKQEKDEFGWKARRGILAKAGPKTHKFDRTTFHWVFFDAIAPVLHINSGESVETATVGAGGRDGKGVRRRDRSMWKARCRETRWRSSSIASG